MENMNLLRFSTTDGIVWYKMDKDNNKKIIGAKNLQEKFKNSPDTTIRFKLDNNAFCSLR